MFKTTVLIATCLFIIACSTASTSSQKLHVEAKSDSTTVFEEKFLTEVNKIRKKARICGNKKFPAASALVLNSKLTSASYMHSLDMFKHQFLEHTSSNGDTLAERMRDVKYAWRAVGENLAHNQKTIQQVIADWLDSPGHCSNLMSSDYTQTGVAVVNGYWTQVYAAPK